MAWHFARSAPLLALLCSLSAGAQSPGSGGTTAPATPKKHHTHPRAKHAAAPAKAAVAPDVGPIKVNDYLSYDSTTKLVTLQVHAAEGSANGGMNFNGGHNGDQTITLPLGWTVHMLFLNKDAIPHSAIVIANQQPFPALPQTPAFPRAYTNHVSDGLPTDGTDDLRFKVDKPGNFVIICGVPGHGPSGMWVSIVVSSDAKAPAYAMGK